MTKDPKPSTEARSWPECYANPPLVEAIVFLRWPAPLPWTADTEARLAEAFRAEFDGDVAEQVALRVEAALRPGGVATEASQAPMGRLQWNAARTAAVGYGPHALSLHVLRPYPGWETFIAAAERAAHVLGHCIPEASDVTVAGLRYLNEIRLPETTEGALSDWFTIVMRPPGGMGRTLAGLHQAIQVMADDGRLSTLTLAAPRFSGTDTGASLVLDLQTWQPVPSGQPWREILEAHREGIWRMFEDSITSQTRELFM